jgi:hypothetical protein
MVFNYAYELPTIEIINDVMTGAVDGDHKDFLDLSSQFSVMREARKVHQPLPHMVAASFGPGVVEDGKIVPLLKFIGKSRPFQPAHIVSSRKGPVYFVCVWHLSAFGI